MKMRDDWELVYEDPLCGLFARKGSPQLERLKKTPVPDVPYDGKGLFFPVRFSSP